MAERTYTETEVIHLLKMMSRHPDSIYEDQYMHLWIREYGGIN